KRPDHDATGLSACAALEKAGMRANAGLCGRIEYLEPRERRCRTALQAEPAVPGFGRPQIVVAPAGERDAVLVDIELRSESERHQMSAVADPVKVDGWLRRSVSIRVRRNLLVRIRQRRAHRQNLRPARSPDRRGR